MWENDQRQKIKRSMLPRGAAALILCGTLILTGCTAGSTSVSTSEYVPVQTEAQEENYKTTESYEGDFVVNFEATSKLTALRIREMYWDYSGDKYVSINVREGDFVSAGDVLAEIEPSISESDLLQKKLNVTQAGSALEAVSTSYEQKIAQKKASMTSLTGTELAVAELELEQLQAEYQERYASAAQQCVNAKNALEEMTEHQETTQLIAPYDGYVSEVIWGWREGDVVPTDEPLLVLADVSSYAIRVTNPSAYGNAPYMGQVELIDQKDQSSYTGTIISGAAITGESSDELIILPDIPEDKLGTALMGSIKVKGTILDEKNVVLCSSDAVYKDGDTRYVLVLAEDNAVSKTYVTVGGISEGIAWITDGLDAGETLVLN